MIAAIVLTYNNRAGFLKKCLESLLNQAYPLDKIFIADNASSFETKKLIQEYSANSKISLITFEENLGSSAYSLALEKVYQEQKYSWILIIDDDGILKFDALEKLVKSEQFNLQSSLST